jgi:predicted porin
MQKKVIALAVAGLVSGAAFAQSNVTIYGIADAGYTYANKALNDGSKNYSAINSGAESGSRLGFRGTEDLGNGLSANFHVVMGFAVDTGTSLQNGSTFGRWSTVGLSSKTLGEVEVGRRDGISDQFMGTYIDPTGGGTIARHNAVWGRELTDRLTNAVVWTSPDWSGLTVKGAFSTNQVDSFDAAARQDVEPIANTSATTQSTQSNRRAAEVGVTYANGPIAVGASYQWNRMQQVEHRSGIDDYRSGNYWQAGAAYDFKVVKLSAAYARNNYAENTQLAGTGVMGYTRPEERDYTKRWFVGLGIPIGSMGSKVAVTYGRTQTNYLASGQDDSKSSIVGLAYFHYLSKRTDLYAAYAHISNNDAAESALGIRSEDRVRLNDSSNSINYEQGVQFGIRHKF